MVGAEFTGQFFQDRFLIADVVMKSPPQPAQARSVWPEPERWFWFDPPFHRGQSVLLHKQCDDVWRIDFQLGWDADPEAEKQPERVIPRIQAMLGPELPSSNWNGCRSTSSPAGASTTSATAACIFAGDAAHQVSPFGARGANTGVQDVDNLAWKLKLVLDGTAPEALIDSYHEERAFAADDNLLQLHPRHRLHHAEEPGQPALPQRGAGAGAHRALRAPAGQQRPAVDADALPALVAEHARRGRLRRPDAAGHQLRRRAGAAAGQRRLAAEPAEHAARPGRRLHAAGLRRAAAGGQRGRRRASLARVLSVGGDVEDVRGPARAALRRASPAPST